MTPSISFLPFLHQLQQGLYIVVFSPRKSLIQTQAFGNAVLFPTLPLSPSQPPPSTPSSKALMESMWWRDEIAASSLSLKPCTSFTLSPVAFSPSRAYKTKTLRKHGLWLVKAECDRSAPVIPDALRFNVLESRSKTSSNHKPKWSNSTSFWLGHSDNWKGMLGDKIELVNCIMNNKRPRKL